MARFEEKCAAVVFSGLGHGEHLLLMEHPMRDRLVVEVCNGRQSMKIMVSHVVYKALNSWLGLTVEEPEPVEEAMRIADCINEERIVPFPKERIEMVGMSVESGELN